MEKINSLQNSINEACKSADNLLAKNEILITKNKVLAEIAHSKVIENKLLQETINIQKINNALLRRENANLVGIVRRLRKGMLN